MSFAKQVLFGDDPRDDHLRAKLAEQAREVIENYVHKIGTRRKNRISSSPRWDPAWSSCLTEAARDLRISFRYINSQICFLTESDKEAVRAKAEELHALHIQKWRS